MITFQSSKEAELWLRFYRMATRARQPVQQGCAGIAEWADNRIIEFRERYKIPRPGGRDPEPGGEGYKPSDVMSCRVTDCKNQRMYGNDYCYVHREVS